MDHGKSGDAEKLRSALAGAEASALRVHDSPVRSDQLFRELDRISQTVASAGLGEEQTVRVEAAIADAMRVLRRDDDGREAAKHLQTALSQFIQRERKTSPFLDDL